MTDTTDFRHWRKFECPSVPHPESVVYKKHKKRGIAIIFNHKEYDDAKIPLREGTDKDRDDLHGVLKDLKFDVSVFDNLSSDEINDVLSKVQNIDHSNNDCLLVTVMSHGEPDSFYTRDKVFLIKNLWQPFYNVPSLVGKPKIFFIQACRGPKSDPGVVVSYGFDETDGREQQKFYSLPITSDILVMYSTFEGYVAYRHPKHGSNFIQSLVRLLKTAEDRNLQSILTDVSREVAINYEDKEMCTIVTSLTRRFYLD